MNLIDIYKVKYNAFQFTLEELTNFTQKVESEFFGAYRYKHLHDLYDVLEGKKQFEQYEKEQAELKALYEQQQKNS